LVAVALLPALALALAYMRGRPDQAIVWPLVLFTAVVPWLSLPGAPPRAAPLLLGVALIGTTALAHVLFFGEDRYHIVTSPVLCLLAAAALRGSSAVLPTKRNAARPNEHAAS
jgi:hypothetical protein